MTDGVKRLNSLEDAVNFLIRYKDDTANCPDVEFGGDLATFRAHIEGKNYNGTVPGELARGLVELQDELYRAAAFALHGNESIKKLRPEERKNFELIFKVEEGSTDLIAQLKTFMEKLADGFTTMTSGHKTITLVMIVAILAGAWGADRVLEHKFDADKENVKVTVDAEKEKEKHEAELAKEKEKTEQFKVIAELAKQNTAAARFVKANEEGARAIIKGASDAQSIKIGTAKFDRDQINEVNQRSAKEKSDSKVLIEDFYISRVEFRGASTLKLWLAAKGIPEFSVIISDDDEMDVLGISKIWDAARDRKAVRLEVSATYVRNQIRAAHVVRVM